MFKRAGSKSSNVKGYQFWQHNNKPIELWSTVVIEQKADYLHNNPVAAGFVDEPWHWKYSSAIDYSGRQRINRIGRVGVKTAHATRVRQRGESW